MSKIFIKYICTKVVLLSMVFLSAFLILQAQQSSFNNGKIIGRVIDSISGKALEYAVINIYTKDNTKPIASTASNTKGFFTVDKLSPDNYRLTIEFVGYKTKTLIGLIVKNNDLSLGSIGMITAPAKALQEVTVFSKAPIIENKIDKVVYNAANDITSQGGVALDVLKKVPQVTVDIDGNVELQGNSSIKFLINGKPSTAFGNSIVDALSSIPANQIKSIEAITSPGAKYDAEGTGGIINIILKDNKVKGVNGSANLSAGTRLENGSFNFNFRNNNFGINSFFSGNAQLNSRSLNNQDRLSIDSINKQMTHIVQDGYADFVRHSYRTGIGFDWTLHKKETITGSISYVFFDNNATGITNQVQQTKDFNQNILSNIISIRQSTNDLQSKSVEWSVNYKRTFNKEKQELDFLVSSSYNNNISDYTQVQNYPNQTFPFSATISHNPGHEKETQISADYSHPINEDFLIETGAKFINQDIFSEAGIQTYNPSLKQYYFDTTQSYTLNYNRKVYAGYLSTNFLLLHFFDVKAGVRFEHTDTKIDFPNAYIPSYNSWVPSIMLLHELPNKQSIKLAYTHRIERPDYREVNPFKNLSDPYNISTGNPLLQPELGNNVELGYNKSFEKGGSIYIAAVARANSQDIKPYTDFYSSYKIGDSTYYNVSVSTRKNIGLELRSGVTISLSLPIHDKWNIRWNAFLSNRHIVNDLNNGKVTDGFDGRTNINISYQMPHDLIMESFVNYNSSVNNIQGKQPQFFNYTFGLRKQFRNKKASFGFTTTNPFNEYVKQLITVTTSNYTSTSIRNVPLRSFGISLLFKFGKLQFKKEKEKEETNIINPTEN